MAAAVMAVMAVLATTAASAKPSVLFVVVDDLGFDDVGFRSHEIRTPVIDSLASTGVVLDQYFVQDVCSPSRAVFMTGRYSMHNSIVDWIPPASAYGLPLNETTMAQKFTEAGYTSHCVGKWHLGFYRWDMTPTFRGFSSFVGFYSGGEDYFTHEAAGAYDFRKDIGPRCGKGCSQVYWQAQDTYSTTVFANRAVELVKNHTFTEPLFLYLAFQGVHAPAQVPPSYEAPYMDIISDPKRRTFAGMLSAVDEGLGNVTDALKSVNAWENTLVVFTADNGGPTTTGDGVGARNWPLRGGKHSVWEGGTRATGLISGGPGVGLCSGANSLCGSVLPLLMHGADWLPTLGDVAGFSVSSIPLEIDGVSQWAALTGASSAPARVTTVIGNSTNMCSWQKSDPRYHGNADPKTDGADLPAGYFGGAAGTLGCGFAIKEFDPSGSAHWKLIKNYGGGPDTWCNSTSNGPTCGTPSDLALMLPQATHTLPRHSCTLLFGKCFPGNDIRHFPIPSHAKNGTAICCAACQTEASCAGFSLNNATNDGEGPTCYLKQALGKQGGTECISGTSGRSPSPPNPAPPEPVSRCPNGFCLYDTLHDPSEEHEISASHPDVLNRMQAQLTRTLLSYTEYKLDKSCPKQTFAEDPHVGKVWQPWC